MNSGDPDGKQFLLHYWIPSSKYSYKPVALFTKVCIVLFFSVTIILRQFPSHFHNDCRMKNFNRKTNVFFTLTITLKCKRFHSNLVSFSIHMRRTNISPSSDKMKTSARRKPNWTAAKLEMLAQAVSENSSTLRGKFSMGLTNDIKN